jgi:hypothetical protein
MKTAKKRRATVAEPSIRCRRRVGVRLNLSVKLESEMLVKSEA